MRRIARRGAGPAGDRAGAQANTSVDAAGNPFTGGLAFTPQPPTSSSATRSPGPTPTSSSPHGHRDHGLFRLGGTFGPPITAVGGFAPAEKVSRAFDAGTFHYFCEIHPVQMHGVVAAAMRVSSRPVTRTRVVKKRRHGKLRKRKSAFRAPRSPPSGHGAASRRSGLRRADVAGRRLEDGRDGVTALTGVFDGGKPGTVSSFRARVAPRRRPGLLVGLVTGIDD